MILGEIAGQLIEDAGIRVVHRRELGGTQVLFHALEADELDVYPEYTGTISGEILAGQEHPRRGSAARGAGRARHRDEPAAGIQRHLCDRHARGGRRPAGHPHALRPAEPSRAASSASATNSWSAPTDGPACATDTASPSATSAASITTWPIAPSASGEIQATDLYSTDAEIRPYKLRVLDDDLQLLPVV